MLSEAEQRRLAEIESSLRLDYPRLARRFAGRTKPWTWRTWPGLALVLVMVAAVMVAVVGLAGRSVAVVVGAIVAVGVCVATWAAHRRSVWRDCR
jgi:hypothetical protein